MAERKAQMLQTMVMLALAAWGLQAHAAKPAASIVLCGLNPERAVACLDLEPGAPFHLDFINSIYRVPVREIFTFEPGKGVFLISVESPSAAVFEYYELVPPASGKLSLRRGVGDIRVLSSDYKDHRLTAGDRTLRLKGLVPDGEPLLVRVREGRCK